MIVVAIDLGDPHGQVLQFLHASQTAKSSTNNNCPIMLICRSGNRSEKAGLELIEKGMTNIYHITDGFEGERDDNNQRGTIDGWRFHGLPWEQA